MVITISCYIITTVVQRANSMTVYLKSRLLSLQGHKKAALHGKINLLLRHPIQDRHPKKPARTRFAPSPTGFLHLGSLRTALFNYLLAKKTGGQFLLRLEDTDRTRLVPGSEQNLYDSFKWLGIQYDEGPGVNETYGPYRQSDRTEIYKKYSDQLISTGHAYRCFCSKERLKGLRDSAMALKPPTNVTYDRHCAKLSKEDIRSKIKMGVPYTIRLKSPEIYEPFEDLLHNEINLQPQINPIDVRYDDPILIKSSGLPTYHFAHVIDDHLMEITHVIRGQEWLPATPKHIVLYKAFGWNPPQFIHLPLLASTNNKKLSKRKGDTNIQQLREKGILPEALINFCVLFGWAPPSPEDPDRKQSYRFSLAELENLFNLNHLTKGNAKLDESRLWNFNKYYLTKRLSDKTQFSAIAGQIYELLGKKYPNLTLTKVEELLMLLKGNLATIYQFESEFHYLFTKPEYTNNPYSEKFILQCKQKEANKILHHMAEKLSSTNVTALIEEISKTEEILLKTVFESVRFALAGSRPGLKVPVIISVLGVKEAKDRMLEASAYLDHVLKNTNSKVDSGSESKLVNK
ncbi:glutamate--tRNA ligase MSE1 Ecym_2626 [Eremothecium cymbalariae DBVPG|uniref:Glutamate--tRNA ligase, mitochondrial n=1 Tax=Eremothecium cymbalariae (strain CBS 270.75 / DBVPG 7215 / KCTC 17166 / NRRL Y-17582) TaxID=931890 RepID=G8JQK6_ERECY|nr:Hypothetical protein Ecym_2626 [Eremothecium cymbalariae DBVPG\